MSHLLDAVIHQNSTYPEAGYPDRLGPSGIHFLAVIALHIFMAWNFLPNCQILVMSYVLIFYLHLNKYVAVWRIFSTSNCQCSLFSMKNPIIWIFCISGWLAVQFNSDKWSSTILLHFLHDRSSWSPPFSSPTFQNICGIADLIFEVAKFQHNTFKAMLPM
jgi:hypothetical protein